MKTRHEKTIDFLKRTVSKDKQLLDLGTPNELSKAIGAEGYRVRNTGGEDLDVDFKRFTDTGADVVTAFEIFEHLVAPFNVLSVIDAPELVASIPLRLWFATAYWNNNDPWDRHYHEFEPRQFDMLLDRSGWEIIASEKWKSPDPKKIGLRPILRWLTDRYYIVHCRRKPDHDRSVILV
jgi:hypothetical protein